jgi:hypothetical protein
MNRQMESNFINKEVNNNGSISSRNYSTTNYGTSYVCSTNQNLSPPQSLNQNNSNYVVSNQN